jgi:hypothetical protein
LIKDGATLIKDGGTLIKDGATLIKVGANLIKDGATSIKNRQTFALVTAFPGVLHLQTYPSRVLFSPCWCF